jgi:acylphosphatase
VPGTGTGAGAGLLRARVTGRVQGVGFRWAAIHEARQLGLRGRVRNAADGSVEIEAAGSAGPLAEFLAWLNRGPPGARVTGVEVDPPGPWRDDFDAEF